MVRRTKEEAQETRTRIIDTAAEIFYRRGLSRTSLHDIAQAAGVTRGAVYWHFKDKAELFNAMMDRATLPFEQTRINSADDLRDDPLGRMRANMLGALTVTANDPQVRRVFEIALHKVEYVAEQQALLDRHLAERNRCVMEGELALRAAIEQGLVKTALTPRAVALGLFSLMDGLLHNWLIDRDAFDLVAVGTATIDTYLSGLRCNALNTRAGGASQHAAVTPKAPQAAKGL